VRPTAEPTLKEARLLNVSDPTVHVRRDRRAEGVIAYLTIDDGRGLNVMSSAAVDTLTEALLALADNQDLRAVVLTGAGPRAFSVGADIKELAAIETSEQAKVLIARLHRSCEAIRNLPVPAIARIHGFCLGAGLEIAAACDVRIASEVATFGMQEVKIGIPSVIEAALLPTLIGWGRTREILYLGEPFTAADALAWRLVEHVVPASSLDQAIESWIGKLLTSAPRAVRLQKRLVRQWEELPLSGAIAAGIGAFAAAYATDEPRAAMRKFLAAKKTRNNGS